VVESEGGFIFTPQRPEEIAERIRVLFNAPELMTVQGMYNIERVKRCFTLEVFIDKV